MRSERDYLIIIGSSSALGREVARICSAQGVNVVLVDVLAADPDVSDPPPRGGIHVLIGSVIDENLMETAFATCEAATSISVAFVVSGRAELAGREGLTRAADIQIQALHSWGSRFLRALCEKQIDKGTFFLISSVVSELQGQANPFYGALKAGAESLARSLAIQANYLGRGAFVTLRLGYIRYEDKITSTPEHPSRAAARALLGKRPLAEWGDVARVILSIVKLESQVINGSTLWCDFGVHLLEQNHVMEKSLGLGDAET